MSWIESLLLGVLQGLTEFLPVSSSGHLVVAEGFFAQGGGTTASSKDVGAENLFFNVMLHLGTLGAILLYYRGQAVLTMRGLLGTPASPAFQRDSLIRTGALAALATLPAVFVALFLKDLVTQATAAPSVAGIGFLVTATVLVTSQRLRSGEKGPREITWSDALIVGIAQAIAITPGISRSGMTIVAALAVGFSRPWAVGFSLLMAIPALLGAGVMEIKDLDPATVTQDRVIQTVVATLIAGIVGYGAIVWLIRIVRSNRLWYFSVYLVLLAFVVLLSFPIRGRSDAGATGTMPLDRPDRVVTLEAAPEFELPLPLDRADRLGAAEGAPGAGAGRSE